MKLLEKCRNNIDVEDYHRMRDDIKQMQVGYTFFSLYVFLENMFTSKCVQLLYVMVELFYCWGGQFLYGLGRPVNAMTSIGWLDRIDLIALGGGSLLVSTFEALLVGLME